jgi:hypothetical protein
VIIIDEQRDDQARRSFSFPNFSYVTQNAHRSWRWVLAGQYEMLAEQNTAVLAGRLQSDARFSGYSLFVQTSETNTFEAQFCEM